MLPLRTTFLARAVRAIGGAWAASSTTTAAKRTVPVERVIRAAFRAPAPAAATCDSRVRTVVRISVRPNSSPAPTGDSDQVPPRHLWRARSYGRGTLIFGLRLRVER